MTGGVDDEGGALNSLTRRQEKWFLLWFWIISDEFWNLLMEIWSTRAYPACHWITIAYQLGSTPCHPHMIIIIYDDHKNYNKNYICLFIFTTKALRERKKNYDGKIPFAAYSTWDEMKFKSSFRPRWGTITQYNVEKMYFIFHLVHPRLPASQICLLDINDSYLLLMENFFFSSPLQ